MEASIVKVKNRSRVCILLIVPVVAVVTVYALLAQQLPEQIASHWSSTYPDGFTRTAVFVPDCILLSLAGALIGLVAIIPRINAVAAFTLIFIGGILSWSVAGMFVSSVIATALAESPETAVLGGLKYLLVAMSIFGIAPLRASGVYESYVQAFKEERRARIEAEERIQGPFEDVGVHELTDEQTEESTETMLDPKWIWLISLTLLTIGVLAAGSTVFL